MSKRTAAFTLGELLISLAVLTVLVLFVGQMFNGAMTVVSQGTKHMEAESHARPLFDRLAVDIAQMVKRTDVSFYLKCAGDPMSGTNDRIAFFSAVPGYYNDSSWGYNSGYSVVAYRVNTDSTKSQYNKLERMAKGLPLNGAYSGSARMPLLFLDNGSPPATAIGQAWPDAIAPAGESSDPYQRFELVGPQVFRFEYYYLTSASPASLVQYPASSLKDPALDWSTVYKTNIRDISAIVVDVAVIDPQSRRILSKVDIATLTSQLEDYGNGMGPGELLGRWQNTIDSSNLPHAALQGIRLYRALFLSLPMRARKSHLFARAHDGGAALIIVLALVVLLTGLAVAYLSRATTDRQLSHVSYNNTAANVLARSALDIVVADFRHEIASGSNPAPIPGGGGTCYFPLENTNMMPQRIGSADTIPNLIRRSDQSDAASRASALSSTENSANGRSVSRARWNTHYLIPRSADAAATYTDTTPIGDFAAPDWVLITRNGPAVLSWGSSLKDPSATNSDYVVGRYAYAVYDEGGLLDINVAGYPQSASAPSVMDIGRKGINVFADLTMLPATTGGNPLTSTAVNKIVLFRNYATTGSSTTLGATTSFNSTATANFVNYYLGNPQTGTSSDFGIARRYSSSSSGSLRTDQIFQNRGELIKFATNSSIANMPNALQYLGTFSREKNQPSWPQANSITISGNAVVFPSRFAMSDLDIMPGHPPPHDSAGLHWTDPAYTEEPPSALTSHGYWQYFGHGGSSSLNRIPAILNPQGTVNSNADLPQYLNYFLFGGSSWSGTSDDADPNHLRTTLSVVAALIDQYDPNTDEYTDTGSLSDCPGSPCGGSTTTRIDWSGGTVYGVEETPPDPHRPYVSPTGLLTDPAPSNPPAPAAPPGYYAINRPFRNVGEVGYSWIWFPSANRTFDFKDPEDRISLPDPALLDLFTYNTAAVRSGTVNINTRQPYVLAAILRRAITTDSTAATVSGTNALTAAQQIVNATASSPAKSRADIARLASVVTPFISSEETRETVARALAECTQTRTWGLMIDVIAQTGHYGPNANSLADFIVEGEKRCWLHIAIDRFTGEILDEQLELVNE